MYKKITETAAGANNSNTMGRETILKSRVNPKNDRSRGNILKRVFLFCFVICVSGSLWGQKTWCLNAYNHIPSSNIWDLDRWELKNKESLLSKYDEIIIYEYRPRCLFAVKLNNKWSIYNVQTGKEIMPFKYDGIDGEYLFEEEVDFVRVQIEDKIGFVNELGKEIISPKYNKASRFKDGFAFVTLNGKQGLIDTNGKEIIPLKYDDVRGFGNDDLACVKLNGKWGYVDKTGKEVIPLKYDDVEDFANTSNYTKVTLSGKKLKIDRKGNESELKGLVLLDPAVYDCGKVPENTEIKVIFRLKNEGKQPITITNVKATCKAVALEPTIKSGEVGRIQVTLTSYGPFDKFINVLTDSDPPVSFRLEIRGHFGE